MNLASSAIVSMEKWVAFIQSMKNLSTVLSL